MKAISEYFSIVTEYDDITEILFTEGSYFFHGANIEERSSLSANFKTQHPEVQLVFIDEIEAQSIKLSSLSLNKTFSLRSQLDSDKLSIDLEGKPVYVDITGLTHSTWSWIVKSMLSRRSGSFWALYSEPIEYKFHEAPLDGQMFDLSEKILEIAPLPGLARISRITSEDFIFMPLLGFEGARLAHLMENVQPKKEFTFPVIGVPGFQHDFPFHAYQGNRLTLEREGIWRNWRYEKASCPASIYILGEDFLNQYPKKLLRIAPIGTKPHALGAVLLKLTFPSRVDLIYDHPLRKVGRTTGKSKAHCYSLDCFMDKLSRE